MARALVTRGQWLDAGSQAFGKAGLSGLNVEAMAARLGSSKAGFYWYFKSRARFEAELFEHWREAETKRIIAAAEAAGGPGERLVRLFLEATRVRSGDFLFHLRRLARKKPRVARLLSATERERIGYLALLLVELGKPEDEALESAEALYHLYLGWYERNHLSRPTAEELAKQARIAGRLVGVELALPEGVEP